MPENKNYNYVYGFDYNAELDKIYEDLANLENQKENLTDDEYVNEKTRITDYYITTLQNKARNDEIYGAIATEKERLYYSYATKLLNGTLDEDFDPEVPMMYNLFFSADGFNGVKNGNFYNNRTVQMGSTYYNRIINYANDYGVDFEALGITRRAERNEFVVPNDTKACLAFSELYYRAVQLDDDGQTGVMSKTWNFVTRPFRDTASEGPWGDGKYYDHEYLWSIGETVADARDAKKTIETNYGLKPYFMPIISPGSGDISRMYSFVTGEPAAEINLIDKNLASRIYQADLRNYNVYANKEAVGNENGGLGNLSLLENDNQLKSTIKEDIVNAINKGNIQFSFATKGYSYGTSITLTKGTGNYTIFIEELLPSDAARDYVNDPVFRSSAYIEETKARNIKNYGSRLNMIGSTFQGSFINAKGDRNMGYSVYLNGEEKKWAITKDEAIQFKYYTEMFNQLCLRHSLNKGDADYDRADIEKFITQNVNDTHSLVDYLAYFHQMDREMVKEQLMNIYDNYYKR